MVNLPSAEVSSRAQVERCRARSGEARDSESPLILDLRTRVSALCDSFGKWCLTLALLALWLELSSHDAGRRPEQGAHRHRLRAPKEPLPIRCSVL